MQRPVLRYPGGKYTLAKWIISHFPYHEIYVEPYGGGGSVLMQKPESGGEIYNDIFGDVVNVFRVLRDPQQAQELERLIRLTPCSYEEYRTAYEATEDPIERARRTIYRSFVTIGADGVSRRNAGFRGVKNYESAIVTAQEWARYPDAINSFTKRLRNVLIENRDAMTLFKTYDRPTTLFYVDPPYVWSTRHKRNLYTAEMSDQDHFELAKVLHQVKGNVVAQNGKRRVECLWLSPNIKTTLF